MENENSRDLSLDSSKDPNKLPRDNSDEIAHIIEWISQIKDENKREQALGELSRKRESFADLAIYLWFSTGTVFCLYKFNKY
jgi:CCR4-NOT transcription complex subunit 9